MARYNKLGYAVDQIICEDTALPNAGSADLTNVVTLDSRKSGNLRILVCAASTTVELAGGASLTLTPSVGTTTAATSLVLPATIITQAVQTTVTWLPGVPMCEIIIPRSLIGANKYLKLIAKTTADESADKIEAYLLAD